MPEVQYDDRADEPEWRLPSRTGPGIVGRKVDDSEYQRPMDFTPTTPSDLPSLPMVGFGAGVVITGLAVMLISGDQAYSWIVVVGLAMLGAGLIAKASR